MVKNRCTAYLGTQICPRSCPVRILGYGLSTRHHLEGGKSESTHMTIASSRTRCGARRHPHAGGLMHRHPAPAMFPSQRMRTCTPVRDAAALASRRATRRSLTCSSDVPPSCAFSRRMHWPSCPPPVTDCALAFPRQQAPRQAAYRREHSRGIFVFACASRLLGNVLAAATNPIKQIQC